MTADVDVPERCRAAALVRPGEPLEVVEVPIPRTLEPGSILVKMEVASVCATDVHLARGHVDPAAQITRFPAILGHEQTGRIVRFGDGPRVDSVGQALTIGDRLVWSVGTCGRCFNCTVAGERSMCLDKRRYMYSPCDEHPYLTGGFAEYAYVYPTSGRIKVPGSLSDVAAASAACAHRTVTRGINDRLGEILGHQTVVIQGSGPLGLFALAQVVARNPKQVIVIGGGEARLSLATRWGAHHTIDVRAIGADARQEVVMDLTDGRGADIVIEVSGAVPAFSEGMAMLAVNGRYLVIGQGHGEAVSFHPSAIVYKQARIIGSLSATIEHYWSALDFMARHRGRFDWDAMISNRYPLEQVNDALDSMARGEEIKPAITFG